MEQIYTVEELAKILKISKWSLYRLVEDKKIPHIKLGSNIRFTDKAISKFIEINEKRNYN